MDKLSYMTEGFKRLSEQHQDSAIAYLEAILRYYPAAEIPKAQPLRLVVRNDSPKPLTDSRVAELVALLEQARPRGKR